MTLPQEQSSKWQWKPELFLAYRGDPAFQRALSIARELRHQRHSCYLDFSGGSLKSQLRLANKIHAGHVLFIGEDELARDKYSIKRMDDSQQWEITLSELVSYIQSRVANQSY
jgi:histidyl-tRNA synthetase